MEHDVRVVVIAAEGEFGRFDRVLTPDGADVIVSDPVTREQQRHRRLDVAQTLCDELYPLLRQRGSKPGQVLVAASDPDGLELIRAAIQHPDGWCTSEVDPLPSGSQRVTTSRLVKLVQRSVERRLRECPNTATPQPNDETVATSAAETDDTTRREAS